MHRLSVTRKRIGGNKKKKNTFCNMRNVNFSINRGGQTPYQAWKLLMTLGHWNSREGDRHLAEDGLRERERERERERSFWEKKANWCYSGKLFEIEKMWMYQMCRKKKKKKIQRSRIRVTQELYKWLFFDSVDI